MYASRKHTAVTSMLRVSIFPQTSRTQYLNKLFYVELIYILYLIMEYEYNIFLYKVDSRFSTYYGT